ncbi:MAG TPA: HAD-IB family phosphatase [Steroidobacteraceae bacterium]|nr:HAD-IB family phosphatase [Steroidobacteraceae bacterium]
MPGAEVQHAAPRALALFDLDGTLTRHDTLSAYAGGFLLRHPHRLARLLRVVPDCLRFVLGDVDQGALKSSFIGAALGGCSRTELDAGTAKFVARLVRGGLHSDGLAQLTRHREQGDLPVLLSASTDLYVPAIGRELGFAEVRCTELEWQEERLLGRLRTANCRGTEKARYLAELRQRYPGHRIVAYANAGSDLEHLRMADEAVLVNGSHRVRRLATALGIACRTWR